jgi:hypothetical protein
MGKKGLWLLAALIVLNVTLLIAQAASSRPSSLVSSILGVNLVRAEVFAKSGGVVHDYYVDRGRIRSISGSSVTLAERDGSVVTVPVAPTARVTVGGVTVRLQALRRGMRATTVREGSAPALDVEAFRK